MKEIKFFGKRVGCFARALFWNELGMGGFFVEMVWGAGVARFV